MTSLSNATFTTLSNMPPRHAAMLRASVLTGDQKRQWEIKVAEHTAEITYFNDYKAAKQNAAQVHKSADKALNYQRFKKALGPESEGV